MYTYFKVIVGRDSLEPEVGSDTRCFGGRRRGKGEGAHFSSDLTRPYPTPATFDATRPAAAIMGFSHFLNYFHQSNTMSSFLSFYLGLILLISFHHSKFYGIL